MCPSVARHVKIDHHTRLSQREFATNDVNAFGLQVEMKVCRELIKWSGDVNAHLFEPRGRRKRALFRCFINANETTKPSFRMLVRIGPFVFG